MKDYFEPERYTRYMVGNREFGRNQLRYQIDTGINGFLCHVEAMYVTEMQKAKQHGTIMQNRRDALLVALREAQEALRASEGTVIITDPEFTTPPEGKKDPFLEILSKFAVGLIKNSIFSQKLWKDREEEVLKLEIFKESP